ncbi:MAG: metallophosphoesterase [Clostridiales bacterium]|jgi:hypothetical protein|nr:metallophosphoesterase [Clostridiales bacterium]
MRWLHLSDIHYNPKKDGSSTNNLRKCLIPYLLKKDIQVNELFITGDFRFAKEQPDTDENALAAVNFIKEIAINVGVKDRKGNADVKYIHIIPGNHDLERGKRITSGHQLLHKVKKNAGDELTPRQKLINKVNKYYDFDAGMFAQEDLKKLIGGIIYG